MASTSADDAEKPGALSGAGFESGAFESLEGDFQEVLQELVGDKSLERFRVEYEKLHRALKKSHESEKRLCLLYTSPSPRDKRQSRMPSSA